MHTTPTHAPAAAPAQSRLRFLALFLPSLVLAAAAGPARAQEPTVAPPVAVAPPGAAAPPAAVQESTEAPPLFGGIHLVLGSPQGDFAKNVEGSYGIDFHMGVRLTRALGIRLDIDHLIYGSDTWRAVNPSFPGVSFEMSSKNTMTYFGLGPQLTGRLGPLRPFVNASVGVATLATSTELRGNDQDEPITEDTNFRDYTFAYGAGAGLAIRPPSWNGAMISLGAFYQSGGNAEYVLRGGLRNLGDGNVEPQTVKSRTSVLRYQVGIALGLP